jgi:adenylate kinase family enzyme
MDGILFLVRGLPGSGKTTFAEHIWSKHVVFEADKYFYDENGNYNFDGSKIKDAHAWCKEQVESRMKEYHENKIYYSELVVSNTFTQEWEMEDYFKLAEKYQFKVVSLIVENRHGGKNVHGVPDDKLEIMKNRFEIKL